ncbi:MAG: transcriptional repressor [Dehalococcoidales bacterium]|nr:transcriptional repressor [Dehalococcoidales bacterium]
MSSKAKSLEINRKVLNTGGLRATSQRALILEVIRGGHKDADEIYRQAREKKPRLSLSTVYRTLQILKKLDLIEELHFDEAHHHYEVKSSSEHQHLVCLGCGKVIEVECPLSSKMRRDVARENNFKITGVEIRMEGYCHKCHQGNK